MQAQEAQQDHSFRPGNLFVALGAAMWALDSIFRAQLVATYPAHLIVFCSQSICAFLVLPYCLWHWRWMSGLSWKDWLAYLYLALAGNLLAMVLFTMAFASASNYSVPILIQKVQPFITSAMAIYFLKERPPKGYFLLLAGAVLGSFLLSYRGGSLAVEAARDGIALLLALGAAFLWATGTVVGRFSSLRHSHWQVTSMRYGVSSTLILLALPFWWPAIADRSESAIRDFPIFAGMALVPGLLALFLYYRGLQVTRASLACLLELAYPLAAVVINWAVLGKDLTLLQLLGGAILVASAAVMSLRATSRTKQSR